MKLKPIPVSALVKNLASLKRIAAQKLDVPGVCSGNILYQYCAIMFLQLRIVLRQDWKQVAALGAVMSLMVLTAQRPVTAMRGVGETETVVRMSIKLGSAIHHAPSVISFCLQEKVTPKYLLI